MHFHEFYVKNNPCNSLNCAPETEMLRLYFSVKLMCHFILFSAVIPVAAAIMTPVPLLTALIIMKVRDVCTQKSKILIDSPLDSEDSHGKNGSIVKTSKLEGEDPENESRCPLRNIFPDEVKESESKMKLVGSDANENIA